MKSHTSVSLLANPKSRSCLCSLFITMSLIFGAYFTGTAWLGKDSFTIYDHSTQLSAGVGLNTTQQYTDSVKCEVSPSLDIGMNGTREKTHLEKCNDKCRPIGTESLPKGIISTTSNLEMYPLSGPVSENNNSKQRTSLLALAVGFKQKELVNEIVKKFLEEGFVVMLFHYDGVVNEWHDLEWSDRVIHVSATNQTKWWFAKRFLHPDIVVEYDYIFLWDEDLGVDNFHPGRYLSIIKEEGLEISQPALDPRKSKVHHQITVRRRSRVHRRYYRFKDGRPGGCDGNSTAPPCVGWVEMMAPVFSRAAWRCAWYMIQNDLIHAWGLDMQLGYCAQGDRTAKVGVVDEEYIAHLALPTLGGLSDETRKDVDSSGQSNSNSQSLAGSGVYKSNDRPAIRLRSYAEMRAFRNRWDKAVKDDECWVDPFKQPPERD